jgi:hypothetical protein
VPLDIANQVLLEHEPAWVTFLQHLDRFTSDGAGYGPATTTT